MQRSYLDGLASSSVPMTMKSSDTDGLATTSFGGGISFGVLVLGLNSCCYSSDFSLLVLLFVLHVLASSRRSSRISLGFWIHGLLDCYLPFFAQIQRSCEGEQFVHPP